MIKLSGGNTLFRISNVIEILLKLPKVCKNELGLNPGFCSVAIVFNYFDFSSIFILVHPIRSHLQNKNLIKVKKIISVNQV